MRRLSARVAGFLVALCAASCSEPTEPPRSPDPDKPGVTASRTVSPVICEKNWLYMQDRDWWDESSWLPSGVPSYNDEVCFSSGTTGSESYRVTIDADTSGWAQADSIYVGPGADVTLDLRTGLSVSEEVVVDAGATLTILADTFIVNIRDLINYGTVVVDGGTLVVGQTIVNTGALTLRDTWLYPWTRRITNTGLLELDNATAIADTLENTGDLQARNGSDIKLVSRMEMNGGRLLGSGVLGVQKYGNGATTPALIWNGGTLPQRSGSSGLASLLLTEVTLTLGNTSLTGAIDFNALGGGVVGDVGPNVSLLAAYTMHLQPPVGSPATRTILVDGDVTAFALRATNPLLIGGEAHAYVFDTGNIENRGVMEARGTASLNLSSGSTLRNLGTISGPNLAVNGGTLIADRTGTVSAYLNLSGGAQLVADGRLAGLFIADGGLTVGPGLATLQLESLGMSSTGTVNMKVNGNTAFDRLQISGAASFAGTLKISTGSGFTGGRCGQRMTLITQRNSSSGTAPGRFAQVTGFAAGASQGWRTHIEADSVVLTGYDPTRKLSVNVAGAQLSEGGAPQTANVCLGATRPVADVVTTLWGARTQLVALPPSVTFTAANFALPQRVSVSAIDDAASEGPHSDTLTLATTTTDARYVNATAAVPLSIADNDPAVDLGVALVFSDPPPAVNQAFELRVRVTNLGPGASTGSLLSVPTLAGATLQTSYGSTCVMNGSQLQCPLGALAAGAFADVTLVFRAGAVPGSFANTFRIRGNDWDNVGSNDSVPWALTVN